MESERCNAAEITLKDLYEAFKRGWKTLLLVPLLFAVAAYGVSLFLPKTFLSEAVFSLVSQEGSSVSPTAIVEGFKARLGTAAFAKRLGEREKVNWAKIQFDAKKGYLKMQAKGTSPEEAQARAHALATAANEDFAAESLNAIRVELEAQAVELRANLEAMRAQLRSLQESLKTLKEAPVAGAAAAALQAAGVEPLVAESPDPALAFLRLEMAKLQAEIAATEGQLKQIKELLTDEEALKRLAKGKVPLRLVAPPGLPLEPVAPRPLFNAALAFIAAFLLAIMLIFMQAVLNSEQSAPN